MVIGIFLRHIKAYKGINFIPVGSKYNFVSYLGENGVGKSSILQGMGSFFNDNEYSVNKSAISDGISGNNFPYFVPIFLISKDKITKHKEKFEELSSFFWGVSSYKKNAKEFFDLRDKILDKKDTHYLFLLGEKSTKQVYFGTFEQELMKNIFPGEGVVESGLGEGIKLQNKYKDLLKYIKNIYSYVYIPVEIDAQDFTKIETANIQKIIGKNLKNEIETMLEDIVKINKITDKLANFIKEIENILKNEYEYHTGGERQSKITKLDLVEKILETYFQKRILHKKSGNIKKKISELSSGEKRQALIDLVYAFLKQDKEREKTLIIGIDEPENSLHTSICYDQFEKLQEISQNHQVLITTHWYGFLPIINQGLAHFLKQSRDKIEFFHTTNLCLNEYRTKKIPQDFRLKSTNDLVQSVFHSLKATKPYNWLICEGSSDKIYLEYFLQKGIKDCNLRIIAVGGVEQVKRFYKFLQLPIEENAKDLDKGKIFCLTDTDEDLRKNDIKQSDEVKKVLTIQRLSKKPEFVTSLIDFEKEEKQAPINIEMSLNPTIFKETLEQLNAEEKYLTGEIQDKNGNTTQENLENYNIYKYLENGNKSDFARKYVEIMKSKEENGSCPKDYIPSWVSQIEEFYKIKIST
jgi:predicted ATP-dependent endonuclease of OLD family